MDHASFGIAAMHKYMPEWAIEHPPGLVASGTRIDAYGAGCLATRS